MKRPLADKRPIGPLLFSQNPTDQRQKAKSLARDAINDLTLAGGGEFNEFVGPGDTVESKFEELTIELIDEYYNTPKTSARQASSVAGGAIWLVNLNMQTGLTQREVADAVGNVTPNSIRKAKAEMFEVIIEGDT